MRHDHIRTSTHKIIDSNINLRQQEMNKMKKKALCNANTFNLAKVILKISTPTQSQIAGTLQQENIIIL